ncbi:hypothetical protein Tco_0859373 [Tanacetum coccineum]|uniref:Uncharacterized protein n=1 Tax=Tanacetum coccineum TaxID=301880 RepID=A0ABQ5BFG7_9ASTR
MVLSDSESEDAANSSKQGRNLGEEDVFETPKGKDSGEADICSLKWLDIGRNWLLELVSVTRKVAFESLSLCEEIELVSQILVLLKRTAGKLNVTRETSLLDELADKRLNDELEMTEQQRKRATEVQQQAQYYTEED